jgi:hypothetical protein
MNEKILNRPKLALASKHLRELVKEMMAEGRTQVEIYHIVNSLAA